MFMNIIPKEFNKINNIKYMSRMSNKAARKAAWNIFTIVGYPTFGVGIIILILYTIYKFINSLI